MKKDLTPTDFNAPPRAGLSNKVIAPAGVKLANKLTVLNADRFVFARTGSSSIAALVKKYGDYSTQLEHTVSPTPGNDGIETQARLFVGRKR